MRWADKVRKAAVSCVRAPTDMSNTTPARTDEAKPRDECGRLQARTERVSLQRGLRELQAG